jgi:hypothetical protein
LGKTCVAACALIRRVRLKHVPGLVPG